MQLAGFIQGVTEQFSDYKAGLTLKMPEEDQEFTIDKLRVRLLITNLMNNAMRHGQENPIQIKVSFDDDRGIIEVIDNGEGISEEHLSQISEPFYPVSYTHLTLPTILLV